MFLGKFIYDVKSRLKHRESAQEEDKKTTKPSTNLDNLIEGLLATSTPGEDKDESNSIPSVQIPSTTTKTSDQITTTNTTTSTTKSVKDIIASFTISSPLASLSIVSHPPASYEKGCQTDPYPRHDSVVSTASSTCPKKDLTSTSEQTEDENNNENSNDDDDDDDVDTEEEEPSKDQIDENSPAFSSFLGRASTVMERAIQNNEDFDITVEYGLIQDNSASSKEKESVLDLSYTFESSRWTSSRTITDVNWSEHYKELVLATYNARSSEAETLEHLCDPDGVLLVWSTRRKSSPEFVFTCQSPLMTARFHDFSPNLLVGASYSGQVVLWDMRAKSEPVQRAPISSEGHTHPIRDLSIVGSNNSHSIVTVSSDGKLCKWDTSQLLKPVESMQLSYHKKGGSGIKEDVSVMSIARVNGAPETVYSGNVSLFTYLLFRSLNRSH